MENKPLDTDFKDSNRMREDVYRYEIRRRRMTYIYVGALSIPIMLGLYILFFSEDSNKNAEKYIRSMVENNVKSHFGEIRSDFYHFEDSTFLALKLLKSADTQIKHLEKTLDSQRFLITELANSQNQIAREYEITKKKLYVYVDSAAIYKENLSILRDDVDRYHQFATADKKEIYDELSVFRKFVNAFDNELLTMKSKMNSYPHSYLSYEFPINKTINIPDKKWRIKIDNLKDKNSARIVILGGIKRIATDTTLEVTGNRIAADTIFGPTRISLGESYVFCDTLDSLTEYTIVPTYIQNKILGRSIIGINLSEKDIN